MPANSNVILSHAEINDFNVSRSVIQGRPIFLLGDPGAQLAHRMEGRELMFASVSTSESHRYRMRYIGVFMMAIQDFKRAAGTLNRSRTTRTYIDSGGAWIEKTGIRGAGVGVHIPTHACLSQKTYMGRYIYREHFFSSIPANPKTARSMRLICVASTNRVSQRKALFESPAMRVFRE